MQGLVAAPLWSPGIPSRVRPRNHLRDATRRGSRLLFGSNECVTFTNSIETTSRKKVEFWFTHTISKLFFSPSCPESVSSSDWPVISSRRCDLSSYQNDGNQPFKLVELPQHPIACSPPLPITPPRSQIVPKALFPNIPAHRPSRHIFTVFHTPQNPPRPIQSKWPRQISTQEQKSPSASSTSPPSYAA
jgi:hypothetical protein